MIHDKVVTHVIDFLLMLIRNPHRLDKGNANNTIVIPGLIGLTDSITLALTPAVVGICYQTESGGFIQGTLGEHPILGSVEGKFASEIRRLTLVCADAEVAIWLGHHDAETKIKRIISVHKAYKDDGLPLVSAKALIEASIAKEAAEVQAV